MMLKNEEGGAGLGVAPAGAVVLAPLAIGVYVCAVYGDDLSLHHPRLEEPAQQVVIDLEVGIFSELVPEVGEESMAGGLLLESAGPGGSCVVFEA